MKSISQALLASLILLFTFCGQRESFDVVVVGGGPAGIGAALAAAESGAKTALIERDSRIGGTTVQARVCDIGLFYAWRQQIIAGPAWEMVKEAVAQGGGSLPDFSRQEYDKWMESVRRTCAKDGRGPYWGEWRAETHPGAPRADDRFLHVLTAADVKTPHGIATRLVEEANRDGVTLVIPASREGRAAAQREGRAPAQREGRAPARPTREITLLFNRTGKVGGEIRIVEKDAEGRVLSSKSRPLAETVTPQKGVLLK